MEQDRRFSLREQENRAVTDSNPRSYPWGCLLISIPFGILGLSLLYHILF